LEIDNILSIQLLAHMCQMLVKEGKSQGWATIAQIASNQISISLYTNSDNSTLWLLTKLVVLTKCRWYQKDVRIATNWIPTDFGFWY